MANDKNFILKNAVEVGGPTKVTVGSIGPIQEGYHIAGAVYDNKSFSVSSQASTGGRGLAFKPDGTKMYVASLSSDAIYQYSLSTPYDVTTASYDSVSFSVVGQDGTPVDLTFNLDGTKFYLLGFSGDSLYQYSLSTAWDISTASYDSVSLSVSSQDTLPFCITFNSSGTKLYMGGNTNNSIYQYSLSTAFDLSTASYDSVSLNISTEDQGIRGIALKSDNNKLYMLGNSNDTVFEYNLSSSSDLSTASYSNISFSVAAQSTDVEAFVFSADGTKMFTMSDSSGLVYQYSATKLLASVDLSTGNYFKETLTANTTYSFTNPAAVQAFQFELTGGAVLSNSVGDLSLVGSFDIGTASGAGGNSRGIYVKPDGTKFWMSARNATVYAFSMSTAWDVTTASYDSVSFSTSGQDGDPQGLFFKSDGTKMYIAGSDTNDIFEYNLSTAWDISTASYNTNFAVTSANFNMTVSFNDNGTKMYVTDNGTDTVYSFNLGTAWSISSASASTSFSYSSETTEPITTAVNSDGSKMYMMASSGTSVYEYALSTAYSPSSATLTTSFTTSTNGDDIHFDTGTSNFFIQDGGTLTQYIMQTGASVTWPASVQWTGGTAPQSPAVGEKDVYTFVTDDGGTSYVGIQSADNIS